MPKLFISENGKDSLYEIVDDEVALGRGAANGVQLEDSHASKQHAVIRRIQGHFKLVDLESKNGVRVNGMFRNQHWLRDGDVVSVGHATLRYAGKDAPQGPPAAVAVRPHVVAGPPPAAVPQAPVVLRAPGAAVAPVAPAAAAPVAAKAPAVPAAAPVARAPTRAASSRRRAPQDGYDDDGYDDDLPPPRRSSNSALIVVGGVLAAAVLAWVIFGMLGGSAQPHNLAVQWEGQKLADQGRIAEAVQYAEQHGDPLQERYATLVSSLETWKRLLRDGKERKHNKEAEEFYDKQIFRKQSIYSGFRAKYADSDEDIVKRLREFLWTYRFTPAAHDVLYNDHAQHPQIRDAMREFATDAVKPGDAVGHSRMELDGLLHDGKYGEALRLLTWERDRWKLILTAPVWKDFQSSIEAVIENTRSVARDQLQRDKAEVRKHMSAGERGLARRKLSRMTDAYLGDPELEREVRDLKAELER